MIDYEWQYTAFWHDAEIAIWFDRKADRKGIYRPLLIRKGKIHMAQKLLAFHVEGDSISELKKAIEAGVAKLGTVAGGGESKPEKGGGKTEKGGGSKITVQSIKDALKKLRDAHNGGDEDSKKGIKVVKALLKKFKATASTDLKEDQYEDFMEAVKEAMPEEDPEGEDPEGEDPDDL